MESRSRAQKKPESGYPSARITGRFVEESRSSCYAVLIRFVESAGQFVHSTCNPPKSYSCTPIRPLYSPTDPTTNYRASFKFLVLRIRIVTQSRPDAGISRHVTHNVETRERHFVTRFLLDRSNAASTLHRFAKNFSCRADFLYFNKIFCFWVYFLILCNLFKKKKHYFLFRT